MCFMWQNCQYIWLEGKMGGKNVKSFQMSFSLRIVMPNCGSFIWKVLFLFIYGFDSCMIWRWWNGVRWFGRNLADQSDCRVRNLIAPFHKQDFGECFETVSLFEKIVSWKRSRVFWTQAERIQIESPLNLGLKYSGVIWTSSFIFSVLGGLLRTYNSYRSCFFKWIIFNYTARTKMSVIKCWAKLKTVMPHVYLR